MRQRETGKSRGSALGDHMEIFVMVACFTIANQADNNPTAN
jgi:hypothetical protein